MANRTEAKKALDTLIKKSRVHYILGEENERTNGAVEAYIYSKFTDKHQQLSEALEYCINATPNTFYVKHFIDSFWNEPGLKRSLDKIYEIIVYSLFSTLVESMNLQFVDEKGIEFERQGDCLEKQIARDKYIRIYWKDKGIKIMIIKDIHKLEYQLQHFL